MEEFTIRWRIGGNHGDSTGPRDVGYRLRPGGEPGHSVQGHPQLGLPRSRSLLCGVVLALMLALLAGLGNLTTPSPQEAKEGEGSVDRSAGGVPPQGELHLDLRVSAVCWLESRGC